MPAEQNCQLCSQPAAGLNRQSLKEVQELEPHMIFSRKAIRKQKNDFICSQGAVLLKITAEYSVLVEA